VPNNQTPIQAQKLRLIDDNSQYQALARRSIRYHRSSATEQYDSMTSLIGQRSLQPTAVHIQRWQADALEQVDGAGSVQSTHQHSESYDNNSLSLEDAWHFTPAWMQDLTGADGATASGNPQIEKLNQNLSHYHDSQAKQFIANTTVRDSQVGYWFKLIEHPEIDQHTGADQEFLITAKSYYNQNNLPKDLQQQVHTLISQSQWKQPNLQTEERQANQLILQRRNIPIVSEYNPQQHRPITSPQRAKVVGPSDEEIHVDEWGRIKVRFLFTRKEDHEHDGGAGSNDNDTDSAWIDVLTPWAGEGYGARFLPRIGEIVVINFFDGNIDRPFVTGRIHEAHRSPTKFDNAGKLPDTKSWQGLNPKKFKGKVLTSCALMTPLDRSAHNCKVAMLQVNSISANSAIPKTKLKVKIEAKVLNCEQINGALYVLGKVYCSALIPKNKHSVITLMPNLPSNSLKAIKLMLKL
jgi:type VI secretion system secreted protein VgrG